MCQVPWSLKEGIRFGEAFGFIWTVTESPGHANEKCRVFSSVSCNNNNIILLSGVLCINRGYRLSWADRQQAIMKVYMKEDILKWLMLPQTIRNKERDKVDIGNVTIGLAI